MERKTHWGALLVLSFGFVLSWDGLCGQDSTPEIDVVGLSIVKPDPTNEYGGSALMGRGPGVEVHIRIRDPNVFFIKVQDSDDDEKGTEISVLTGEGKPLGSEDGGGRMGFMSDISEDGQTATIPINGSELPPKGTKELRVKGSVTLVAGNDLKTKSTEFKVVADAEVALGNIATKLSEVEEDPFGEGGWQVTFESKKSLESIREIKFLDEKGEELESSSMGGGSFGFGGRMTYSRSYMIAGKSEKVTAKVSYFESTREVVVPVDLAFGLSFEK